MDAIREAWSVRKIFCGFAVVVDIAKALKETTNYLENWQKWEQTQGYLLYSSETWKNRQHVVKVKVKTVYEPSGPSEPELIPVSVAWGDQE